MFILFEFLHFSSCDISAASLYNIDFYFVPYFPVDALLTASSLKFAALVFWILLVSVQQLDFTSLPRSWKPNFSNTLDGPWNLEVG